MCSEVGCRKEGRVVSWELATSYTSENQLVTSCLALSSSPLRLSEPSDVSARRNVSFLFLNPQHRRAPGCRRCSANVCPAVGAGGGPRTYPRVCSEERWSQEGGPKEGFFQSAESVNAARCSPFSKILHVPLSILEAPRSLAAKKALVLLNPEFPELI